MLGLIIVLGTGCDRNDDRYYVKRVNRGVTLKRFTNTFEQRITNSTEFLERFINSYRQTIVTNVHSKFRTGLFLMQTNAAGLVVFSEIGESFLLISPSPTNVLNVQCTRYPVQLALFTGRDESAFSLTDLNSLDRELRPQDRDLINWYLADTNETLFGEASSNFIHGGTFISSKPRFIVLPERSFCAVRNGTFVLTNSGKWHTTVIRDLGIFTGSKDFGWAVPAAAELGKRFAELEIRNLFFSSQFFRACLAHTELRPIAEKILEREQQRDSGKKDYPFWEYQVDKQHLIDVAKGFQLPEAYASDLLENLKTNKAGGTLFWNFHSHLGFRGQWTIVGIFLLVLALCLSRAKRFWPMRGSLVACVAIHTWIFSKKPDSMGIEYYILPGAIAIVSIIVVSKLEKKLPNCETSKQTAQ